IKEYIEKNPTAKYVEGFRGIWNLKCDIALPCATQGEIDKESAEVLVQNGVKVVSEGANMPTNLDAIEVFQNSGIMFGPAKAANAGGVACSALEMSQNSMRVSWSFEEVDLKLKDIMINIYNNSKNAAAKY
ncbi:NADP-specific glutamate dehydrogenase, partial [Clostridium perfringens]|nr:NADP-specific glutamate dehydrogenase [Clostridium perfringens]